MAPGEKIRELTEPGGEGVPAARWHNCQVVKAMSPIRVFEVEKPNGAKEQRTIAQPDVRVHPDGRTSPLGPPGNTGCKPTPEQEREMYILAGVDPDTHEPIGGLPIPPRP